MSPGDLPKAPGFVQPEAPAQDPPRRALTPSVGLALVALAGHPVGERPHRLSEREMRPLLDRALAEMTSDEVELSLDLGCGEAIGLRDVLTQGLATALLSAPRDRNDLLHARRLLLRLDRMRTTAPRAWADAEHNLALAEAWLAAPGDLGALGAARAHYERALTVRTRKADPEAWAKTTVAVADLLRDVYPGHDPAYLDQALESSTRRSRMHRPTCLRLRGWGSSCRAPAQSCSGRNGAVTAKRSRTSSSI